MAPWINRLFQSSPALLGLDLADAGLHLVELRQQARGLLVTRVSAQPLPQGCVVGGNIQQFDALVLALRQLLQRQPVSTRALAMALPTSAIRLDTWQAPSGLGEQGLDEWVRLEATQRWQTDEHPLSLDCAYWPESVPASPPVEGAPGLAAIWVAAAPLEMVQDRQGLAEACGLQLTILEDAAAAASRAWRRVESEQISNGAQGPWATPTHGRHVFSSLQKGRHVAEWPADSATFATACGLALRGFMP